GGFTLLPEFAPRPRPVMRDAGLQRLGQRLGSHMGNHEQPAVTGIGDDGCNKTVGIEAWREDRSFFKIGLHGWWFGKGDGGHAGLEKSRRPAFSPCGRP